MGILDELGVGGSLPKIDITGFLSNSWIYIAIIVFVGLVLIAGTAIFFYFFTWRKKLEFYENISGSGWGKVASRRARVIRVGSGGEELLKPIFSNNYFTAYGKKIAPNTFMFVRGQDGYWYNSILSDFDAKRGMLDIEPVDRDVRMFHVALDRLSQQTYGKQSLLEKYGIHIMLFVFLVVLILGMWFIVGKIGEAVQPLSNSAELSLKIQESNVIITEKLNNIVNKLSASGGSGLIPAG